MSRLKRAEGDASDRRRLPKHMMHEELGLPTEVGQVVCEVIGSMRKKSKAVALRHKSRRSFDERDSADSSAETIWFRASKNLYLPDSDHELPEDGDKIRFPLISLLIPRQLFMTGLLAVESCSPCRFRYLTSVISD